MRKTCVHDGLISIHHLPIGYIVWIEDPSLRTAKLYWLIDPSDLQSKEENTKHEWLGNVVFGTYTTRVFIIDTTTGNLRSFAMRKECAKWKLSRQSQLAKNSK